MSKLDSEMIKNCPNKDECFCVRNFEEKRRNEFLQDKIQSLEQEVARLKEENQNLLNFRILDNERLSKKIFKLEEENKKLKEENLKLNEYKFMYEELCK